MAKVRGRGPAGNGNGIDTPSPPKGVASPPHGVAEGSAEYYDWLATQPSATREWYIEGRFNAIAGKTDPTARKTEARHEQDLLQQAQEKAISQGKSTPDVDPNTGQGIHFSSDKQREQFERTAGTMTAAGDKAKAEALTPEATTVNFQQTPLDEAAAHPEDVVAHYGAATPEQVAQEQAISQTRSDLTGENAVKASLADETAAINQGGLTAIDRARLEQARALRAQQARSAEEAIGQRAEQQGRAGSTASLVMRQGAQQGAENARSQDDLQTMALGLQRKDTLMGQRASQGQGLQSATDAIDHFNTQGARDVAHANAVSANAANTRTSEEQNKRETGNADITNQAIGAGMAYRTGRNQANTGIVNQGEEINKSPTGGARGLVGSSLQASSPLIGVHESNAGSAHDYSVQDAARKAQEEALGWNLAGSALGAAPAFVSPFVKQAKTGAA